MENQKPEVFYGAIASPDGLVVVGRPAYLQSVQNHPRGLRGLLVRTSEVVAYEESTGRIETLNTVYLPLPK